jgi:hypothetical protein
MQSVRDPSQIKEPCTTCGGTAMHRVNDGVMCCKCYVKAGNAPATWHGDCVKWKKILYPRNIPKFKRGDLVHISGRGDRDFDALIEYEFDGSSPLYNEYTVTDCTGNETAWFYESDMTLITRGEDVDLKAFFKLEETQA